MVPKSQSAGLSTTRCIAFAFFASGSSELGLGSSRFMDAIDECQEKENFRRSELFGEESENS